MPKTSIVATIPERPKSPVSIGETTPYERGGRKLVRPILPPGSPHGRSFAKRDELPMLTHQMALEAATAAKESTHAEAFYLQKQVHTQTLMVFVLEDGERIEGYIEWYDRTSIKVRHGGRTLIYKAAIKYLYKANDNGG